MTSSKVLLVVSLAAFLFVSGSSFRLGSRLKKNATRIIGGSPTEDGEFPFAALLRLTMDDGVYYCGGSLVSPSVILTAAHCVEREPSAIRVTLDCATNVNDASCPNFQMDNYQAHPRYDTDAINYDYAMIHLSSKVSNIDPVKLIDPSEDDFEVPDGATTTVVGYGITSVEGTSISSALLQTDLYVVDQDDCNNQYRRLSAIWGETSLNNVGDVITDQMICGMNYAKDACSGDSGGPLFLTCGGDPVQIGVVSFGAGCAYENIPGIFSNLLSESAFDFVKDFVESYGESLTLLEGDFDDACEDVALNDDAEIDYFYPTDEWTCNGYYFAAMDGCDCECGTPDPDCEQMQSTFGCTDNTPLCLEGTCVAATYPTPFPTEYPATVPNDSPTRAPSSPVTTPTRAPSTKPIEGDSGNAGDDGFFEDNTGWIIILVVILVLALICLIAVCARRFCCTAGAGNNEPTENPSGTSGAPAGQTPTDGYVEKSAGAPVEEEPKRNIILA